MVSQHRGLDMDVILRALSSFYGVTTANGGGGGTNLFCSTLILSNDFISGKTILIQSGAAIYEDSGATAFVPGTGEITVSPAFSSPVLRGTAFYILNQASAKALIALLNLILTRIGDPSAHTLTSLTAKWGNIARSLDLIMGARWDAAGDLGTDIAALFHQQADVAVNTTAPNAPAENNVLNLAALNTRYIVRSLRLKADNPNPNNITVRLYELVNDGAIDVDTFIINNTNFGTYHSLMDMFGLPHLAGDNLRVTVQASAGGPYAVTGQYSFATAT